MIFLLTIIATKTIIIIIIISNITEMTHIRAKIWKDKDANENNNITKTIQIPTTANDTL